MDSGFPVLLLNGSIMTALGTFSQSAITYIEARELVDRHGFVSAIGHQATAQVLSKLLGVDVPLNRTMSEQQVGQLAIVLCLRQRAPVAVDYDMETIRQIGFNLKLVERLS